ncbi:MAG: hypothetical protein JNL51_18275 [Chitinophagaceae bacterium]|nr:hypothetical protein [Chitinophagaceae bacterium]
MSIPIRNEDNHLSSTEAAIQEPEENKDRFFPSGAIAFFISLVILTLLFWYGIYFLMIERT